MQRPYDLTKPMTGKLWLPSLRALVISTVFLAEFIPSTLTAQSPAMPPVRLPSTASSQSKSSQPSTWIAQAPIRERLAPELGQPSPSVDIEIATERPPAFGPGTPNYGKPFFSEPSGASQVAPNNQSPLPKPLDLATPIPAAPPQVTLPRETPPQTQALPSQTSDAMVELIAPGFYETENQGVVPVTGTWKFNFHDAPWETVLKNFARHSNMSLQLEQFPAEQLTYYDDRSYSISEGLDVLNDHLLAAGFLLVRNENKLTSISATNAFRDGVVPFVAVTTIPALGRNELVSVAFPLDGGSSPQIVAEVEQLVSPLGRVQSLSSSGRLIVTDTGASLRRLRDLISGTGLAANEIDRVVLHLRNTKAESVAQAINQRLGYGGGSSPSGGASQSGGFGQAGGFGQSSGFGQTGGLSQAGGISQVSATSGSGANGPIGVVAETQTNSLLIEGKPDELARIEYLVREIDRDPPQVMIQALLVEVLLGNTMEFGVELGFQDSVLFDRSVIDNIVSVTQTSTAPNGVQTTNQNVVSQTAAPGFNFNGSPLGNNVSVRPSSVGRQSVSNLGLGRVSGDLGFGGLVLSAGSNSVNMLLRALAEKHKVDVLSRPQVRTVNNHEALIQIGQQVPVVDGVTLSANGTANPIVRQDKAGIILRVTPRISEGGLVQIDVQAEKSAYQLAPGSGVPIFTDASTGNVIEAPVKDITTAQTTVAALSGQTIVLGGMITRDQTNVERKVPFLGDIPLIGRLFRVDLAQTNRKELLIFLTPTVVYNAAESDCVASQEAARMTLELNPQIDLHRDFMKAKFPSTPGSACLEPENCGVFEMME